MIIIQNYYTFNLKKLGIWSGHLLVFINDIPFRLYNLKGISKPKKITSMIRPPVLNHIENLEINMQQLSLFKIKYLSDKEITYGIKNK